MNTTAIALGRDDNDAWWEQKAAEAVANGGSVEFDYEEMPPVEGIQVCLHSGRVDDSKPTYEINQLGILIGRLRLEAIGDRLVEPAHLPGTMCSGRFRLTVLPR